MATSPVPVHKWAYAVYLDSTSLKGAASMKSHSGIGVTQKTAWFMLQRVREAYAAHGPLGMDGPVGKTAVVAIRAHNTGTVDAEVVARTTNRGCRNLCGHERRTA